MDTLDAAIAPAAVAAMPPAPWRRPVRVALLVAVPLLALASASVTAWALVRIVADLRLGIDPFAVERLRPRLSYYERAARDVAVEALRQPIIMVCTIGIAIWCDGTAWRRRLGLTRPAVPRAPVPRPWLVGLLLLLWPAIHIAWVGATAQALHVGFGQNVRPSPFLTPALLALSFLSVALLAPIAEEMLLRGETFARADAVTGPAGAITATTLLFCALHVGLSLGPGQQLRLDPSWYARPITLLPLAVTLGWLRWRTGRLWPCILLHAWSNAALVTYLFWPFGG